MRVRRESTSCDTSLMILAFSLGDRVVNHFASLCEEVVSLAQMSLRTLVGHETTRPYHFALP